MPPDPHAATPAIERLAALLAGSDAAVAGLDTDTRGAEALAGIVSESEHAAQFAACPRPDLRGGAHPARLLLHALARQYRYDGAAPELAAEFVEALNGCLARDATAWADIAAESWFGWLVHEAEPGDGWRIASGVLDLHGSRALPPRMLASFAAMAERAGELDRAHSMWERARAHPDVAASAQLRWGVEFEWARTHLMLAGAAPVRAAHVLERVHAGLATIADERARLAYLSAGLELAFVSTLIGRPDRAAAAIERTRANVADTPEFGPWLSGIGALVHAVQRDADTAEALLAEVSSAVTDTSSLELVATLPAELLVAAHRRDGDRVRRAVAAARAREAERAVDVELRVIWRVFACLALAEVAGAVAARPLADEARACVEASPVPLGAYAPFVDLVSAVVHGDDAAQGRAATALELLGVPIPAGARDPWEFLHERLVVDSAPRLRIDVLGGLRVRMDDIDVPVSEWSGRRKAQSLLGVLVAAGNRVDRETLVDGLWDGERLPASTADSRLWTLLSKIRAVIGADTSVRTTPPNRSITTGASAIELQLGPADVTDVGELREIAANLDEVDPEDPRAFERLADRLRPLGAGAPLDGVGSERIVVEWRRRLTELLVDTAARLGSGWLAATGGDTQRHPPSSLVDVLRSATRLDPLDESAVLALVELLARAGRGRDASRAFHTHRMALDRELGLRPSIELVRAHATVVELEPEV